MEQSSSSMNRQDIACSRCRERKVRCGRERPACMSCLNDKCECDYSVPEKRVNHTKLLCRNFDRLESRLAGIEGELSWLTSRLKVESGVFQQGTPGSDSVGQSSDDSSSVDQSSVSTVSNKPIVSKRVIRGHDDQGDQYHGSGTLVSLCFDLRETLIAKEIMDETSQGSNIDSSTSTSTTLGVTDGMMRKEDLPPLHGKQAKYIDLMDRICAVASFEPPMPLAEPVMIRLPPKQLLLMVLPQFFSHVDYSSDLFVELHLAANIERVYSCGPTPANDAWAICFNTIILLVLGTENVRQGNDPLTRSQFSLPFFQVMQAAFHQAHFLTTPKLINIQALALLSIAAERYYPAAMGCAIFAQACLLARRAGLHQGLHLNVDQVNPDEVRERSKTFISLHLRDKTLALSWASISWLPTLDGSQPLHLLTSTVTNPQISARLHLASIQERLYNYLYTETHRTALKAAAELAGIERSLENWKLEHGGNKLPFTSSHDAEAQLTFLATRMLAYMCSDDEAHRRVIVEDARTSCLILLVAYEKHDETMLKMLQSIHSPSSLDGGRISGSELTLTSTSTLPLASTGRLTPLIDAFPISAFFQLTKHVLWSPNSSEDTVSDERRRSDLDLLRQVHQCIMEVNGRTQSQNRASQNERSFALLLELINIAKAPGLENTPPPSDGTPVPITETWPAAGASLGSRSGARDFLAMFTPISGDMSWDMLDASCGYQGIGGGQEFEREKRKRPRTGDMDLVDMGSAVTPFNFDEPDTWA